MGLFSKIFTRYGRATWVNLIRQPQMLALGKENPELIIRNFFMLDNLHVGKVLGNFILIQSGSLEMYKILARSEGGNVADFFNFITPSALKLTSPLDRPFKCPLWFVAGYPDVLLWLMNYEGKATDEKLLELAKMLGFKKETDVEEWSHMWENKDSIRNLIMHYERRGYKLECGL